MTERNANAFEDANLSDFLSREEMAEMHRAANENGRDDGGDDCAADDPVSAGEGDWPDIDDAQRVVLAALKTRDAVKDYMELAADVKDGDISALPDGFFECAADGVDGLSADDARAFFEKAGKKAREEDARPEGEGRDDGPAETDSAFMTRLRAMKLEPSPRQLKVDVARIVDLANLGDQVQAVEILAKLGITKMVTRAMIKDVKREAGEKKRADASLVQIDVDFTDIDEQMDTITKGLIAANETPYIFKFGKSRTDGLQFKRVLKMPSGLKANVMNADALTLELSNVVYFHELGVRKPIPKDTRGMFMGHADIDIPVLEGIVHTPVFSETGSLIRAEGYHAETKYYFDPSVVVPAVPTVPTKGDVEKAKRLLFDEVFHDFKFNDEFLKGETPDPAKVNGEASRANTLAMLLTSFCRKMTGISPMFLIDKPTPGTGASYLVLALGTIISGSPPATQNLPTTEEEILKTIVTFLKGNREIILFDNLPPRRVDSPALAAFATSDVYSARELGSNTEGEWPNNRTLVMTANNAKFADEQLRRIAPIRMDTGLRRPQDRPVKREDLIGWVSDNRGELVWSCLVLIQNWIAAGKKPGKTTLRSYDRWARAMSGIFTAADIPGFLENIPDFLGAKESDRDSDDGFVEMWWQKYQGRAVTVKDDLIELAYPENGKGFREVAVDLPIAARDLSGVKLRLAGCLQRMKDQPFKIEGVGGGEIEVQVVVVAASKNSKKSKKWQLITNNAEAAVGAAGRTREFVERQLETVAAEIRMVAETVDTLKKRRTGTLKSKAGVSDDLRAVKDDPKYVRDHDTYVRQLRALDLDLDRLDVELREQQDRVNGLTERKRVLMMELDMLAV